MKKIIGFIVIVLITYFFTNCQRIELGPDCNKKPLDKITVTGKVVYEDDSSVKQCYVYVEESQILGFYSKQMTNTTTDQSGEFTLVFTPRQQDEQNWCDVNYTVNCTKENYYQPSVYQISKYKSKQNFKVVLKKKIEY